MPNKPENTYRIKRHEKSIIIIYNFLIYNRRFYTLGNDKRCKNGYK